MQKRKKRIKDLSIKIVGVNELNAESVIINGGIPLKGQVSIQGAKNAALPILAASILFKKDVYLHNVPELEDVKAMLEILEFLGVNYTFKNNSVYLDCRNIVNKPVPMEISNKLRASSLIMGPLLARFGYAEVGMPGGCSIGKRPLDYHFGGFESLGAKVDLEEETVKIYSEEKLKGEHTLPFPSVGATENLITSAVFGQGRIEFKNVAKEPEIIDLIQFLSKSGADIRFTDVSTIEIVGVNELESVEYEVRPDRIEAATFIMAAIATRGDVTVKDVNVDDLGFVIHKLEEMGAGIEVGKNSIRAYYKGPLKGIDIQTSIFPGFPTDVQPQMTILMSQAATESSIVENIFNNRFRHLEEIQKMNAKVEMIDKKAVIYPSKLTGCPVDSFDLRGSAAMIMAGLCAKSSTRVMGMRHLHRGYQGFVEKLRHLGAEIRYV